MHTMHTNHHTPFTDDDGNTYRVEQAHNGRYVVIRINPGGNRKRFKSIAAARNREQVWQRLEGYAETHDWRPLP